MIGEWPVVRLAIPGIGPATLTSNWRHRRRYSQHRPHRRIPSHSHHAGPGSGKCRAFPRDPSTNLWSDKGLSQTGWGLFSSFWSDAGRGDFRKPAQL